MRSQRSGLDKAVPRRWSDELDGIRWLPRLIDKARMAHAGTLGAYLFGHSPFDAALLKRLRVTTDEFITLVASAPDDAAVLAALRTRGFNEASARRWSDRLPKTARFYAPIWDVDDGYSKPSPIVRGLLPIWRVFEHPVMALVRAVRRVP